MNTKSKKETAKEKVITLLGKAQKDINKVKKSKTFKSATKGLKKFGSTLAAKTAHVLDNLSENLKEKPKVKKVASKPAAKPKAR